jgi:hypothetical protein
MKLKAWPLWLTIFTLKNKKNLMINLHKSNIIPSNTWPTPTQISLNLEAFRYDTYYLQWKNKTILHQPRRFARHISNATHLAEWHSQHRTRIWEPYRTDIDWNAVLENINTNCSATSRSTHPKYSLLKAFKIKMLLDELPTALNLAQRNSQKYKSTKCKRCNTRTENNQHWVQCSKNKITLSQIVRKCTQDLLKNKVQPTIINQIIELITSNTPYNQQDSNSNEILIVHGFIPKIISQKLVESNTRFKASKLVHKIQKQLYTKTWLLRCQEWHSIETQTITDISASNIVDILTKKEMDNIKASRTLNKLNNWYHTFSTSNTSTDVLAYITD